MFICGNRASSIIRTNVEKQRHIHHAIMDLGIICKSPV
jgi:hypothetical protein